MSDLDELRAFLAVVETGSVAAASDQLSVPRSTLRRRLDALEQRVGVALLWMDASGAHPTPAARLLVTEGAALIASYENLVRESKRANES